MKLARTLTIKQFKEATDYLNKREEDVLERNVTLVSILTGKDKSEVEAIRPGLLKKLVAGAYQLLDLSRITGRVPRYFFLKGRPFKVCLEITNITAGQYIELSAFAKEEEPHINAPHKILASVCAALFSRRSHSDMKHAQLADFFYRNMPVDMAQPLATYILFCLGTLNSKYSALFETKETEQDDEEEETPQQQDTSFVDQYGWLVTVDFLAGGDRSKWDHYFNMGVIEFLNAVAYMKDKKAEEEMVMRQQGLIK